MLALAVALVGVEPHLAVPQRAQRLAFRIHAVGDHHQIIPFRRVVALGARRRLDPRGNGSEIGGEAALIVLGKILIAEHEHRMRVPGVLDLPDRLRLDRATEIDAADFRANQGVKPAAALAGRGSPSATQVSGSLCATMRVAEAKANANSLVQLTSIPLPLPC